MKTQYKARPVHTDNHIHTIFHPQQESQLMKLKSESREHRLNEWAYIRLLNALSTQEALQGQKNA